MVGISGFEWFSQHVKKDILDSSVCFYVFKGFLMSNLPACPANDVIIELLNGYIDGVRKGIAKPKNDTHQEYCAELLWKLCQIRDGHYDVDLLSMEPQSKIDYGKAVPGQSKKDTAVMFAMCDMPVKYYITYLLED
jgi:hypothetical protein